MIVSFHPVIKAHRHFLCAGRPPGAAELAAMRQAAAVILPQGCRQDLYVAARQNCSAVFPNYDARFRYPGKTGQIRLFQEAGLRHPRSAVYRNLEAYRLATGGGSAPPLPLPLVFKFDWGGEGEGVYRVKDAAHFAGLLEDVARWEAEGRRGFILQELVETNGRSLRVAVMGDDLCIYWRVLERPEAFAVNTRRGARIDHAVADSIHGAATAAARTLMARSAIDLAGLDYLFAVSPSGETIPEPLLLEVNYFFGRRGLGGSAGYYSRLRAAVHRWLGRQGLQCPQVLEEVEDLADEPGET
jgi:ribosomal protein S6--L-glutamate ligase